MKFLRVVILCFCLPCLAWSQTRRQIDSAHVMLAHAKNDTVRMKAYSMLGGFYDDINVDSGLFYCRKAIALADKLDLRLDKAEALAFMSWPLMKTGNYPEALRAINSGLKITEGRSGGVRSGDAGTGVPETEFRARVVGLLYAALESLYTYVGDHEKQITVAREAIRWLESAGDSVNSAGAYADIGDSYLNLNMLDSALYYHEKVIGYNSTFSFSDRKFEGASYTSIGLIHERRGEFDLARSNYLKAIEVSEQHDNPRHAGNACLKLADLYRAAGKMDSGSVYARKAYDVFRSSGYTSGEAVASRMISDYFQGKGGTDSAYVYLKLSSDIRDEYDSLERRRLQEFQVAAFHQQFELQREEQRRVEREGKLKTVAIVLIVLVFSIIAALLFRNMRQKQQANQRLQEKNRQVEQAMDELKSTQAQLIQSEKMASLGELTAGIAHEIQNPLNFVNNFADINKELLEDLKSQNSKAKTAEYDQEEVNDLLNDLEQNTDKIALHGRRADGIVKSMLQHSRTSTGQKEPTDLAVLADEYLKLAYHGMRAKDKEFNVTLETDVETGLPKVNMVPQDIGRVLLNLYNNAFQAVMERKKSGEQGYEPKVRIQVRGGVTAETQRRGGNPESKIQNPEWITLRVIDNGPGIPEAIRDKIFQPFFTTKPTGQGTGLGLSLSYDIVVKGHGGRLQLGPEGDGSSFIVELPL